MQALVVHSGNNSVPEGSIDALKCIGWTVLAVEDYRVAAEAVDSGAVDAVLLADPGSTRMEPGTNDAYSHLLDAIGGAGVAGVVLSDASACGAAFDESLVEVVDRRISLAELRGRFAVIGRYQSRLRRLESRLDSVETMGKRLGKHCRELDEEMRLAARLQRDFLPNVTEPIGNLRFATVFRPASWVSGDTFDIFRIDEHFTGLYLADAVGHGVAASLLTMFIKRAIVPKHVRGDRYTIVSPSDAMSALNRALAEQSLPNCQFVTACYALFDHRTLTLELARGGHTFPLHLKKNGEVREIKSTGGLLGVFAEQQFQTIEVGLEPGDKVLFYTDGIELAFDSDGQTPLDSYFELCRDMAHLPVNEMLLRLEQQLELESGSIRPEDDVTIVGLEVLPQRSG